MSRMVFYRNAAVIIHGRGISRICMQSAIQRNVGKGKGQLCSCITTYMTDQTGCCINCCLFRSFIRTISLPGRKRIYRQFCRLFDPIDQKRRIGRILFLHTSDTNTCQCHVIQTDFYNIIRRISCHASQNQHTRIINITVPCIICAAFFAHCTGKRSLLYRNIMRCIIE